MNPVEEEQQARRAEERAQQYALLQSIPPALVWNRGRGRRERRFHMTPVYVLQNLDNAILNLCKHQLVQQILSEEQQQRTTQDYRAEIIRVEVERQRQVEERQLEPQRVAEKLKMLQAARRVKPAPIVQINHIMKEWRNEDADALDYEELQNRDSNGDLYMDRSMQENILRVVSNIFH